MLPLAAQAQTRVLFVGNSFTHGKFSPVLNYNSANVTDENANLPSSSPRYEGDPSQPGPWGGIPGIFKKMTDQAGLNYEVHIEAVSGQTLQFHYDNARPVIAQATWDKVVLQELSTYPIPTNRTGNRTSFNSAATALEQAVHTANAQAQVYLYETWARADKTYPSGQPYSGLPIDSMTQDLHNGYYRQFAANGHYAAVAPAGDAWLRAIINGVATRNPYTPDASKLNLWASEYYHPSKWGSYLNACVLFYTLTGVDPRTLGSTEQAAAALSITPAAATALQQVAYQQVSGAPLPVQLVAFTARPAGPTVALAWQTASEVNSAHFEVERSSDGTRFEQVGWVTAAGSSLVAHTYSFIDAEVPAGQRYYRLRQVDQDGSAAYSPVRPVQLVGLVHLALYPNPAPGGAASISGAVPGAVVLVCDALGRVKRTTTASEAGTAELTGLPAGLYVVHVGAGVARLSVE